MTDVGQHAAAAGGAAVAYVGAKSCQETESLFGTSQYTVYTFRLSAARPGSLSSTHEFRVRYSQARRSHDEIVRSGFFSDSCSEPVFPASFPLRDMTTGASVRARAAELCAYYNQLLAIEGALAAPAVRRAVGLGPVEEAAVFTAAALYFSSVAAVKARFTEISDIAGEEPLAELPQAVLLGVRLLLDSRVEVAQYTRRMPACGADDEYNAKRHVGVSLAAVSVASHLFVESAVDWPAFELWWKSECLEPIAAAARRALLSPSSSVPTGANSMVQDALPEDPAAAIGGSPADFERVQALLFAEVQARQQAQADLEATRRVLAQERTLRIGMQQERLVESSPDAAASVHSDLSFSSEATSDDLLQQWRPRTDVSRILPSPSNLLDESAGSNFGGHLGAAPPPGATGGTGWVDRWDSRETGGEPQSERGRSDKPDRIAAATRDDELIVISSGRRKAIGSASREGNARPVAAKKSLLARTLFEEQKNVEKAVTAQAAAAAAAADAASTTATADRQETDSQHDASEPTVDASVPAGEVAATKADEDVDLVVQQVALYDETATRVAQQVATAVSQQKEREQQRRLSQPDNLKLPSDL